MLKTSAVTVAIGALGAPIHLSSKASRFNGSSQFSKLLTALCKNPKISQVVVLGTFGAGSDTVDSWKAAIPDGYEKIVYPLDLVHRISREGLQWHKKTFTSLRKPDAEGAYEIQPYWCSRAFQDLYAKYVSEKLPSIDFGLFFMTQGATGTAVEGAITCKTRPDDFRLQLPSARKHYAPFIHAINVSKMPWFMLSTDTRVVWSMPRHEYGINPALEVLDQWNHEIPWDVVRTYDLPNKYETLKLQLSYSGIERLNLIGTELTDPNMEKRIPFAVVANQTTCSNDLSCSRFSVIKEWILDHDTAQQFHIYGEFDSAFITGYRPADSSKAEHHKLIAYNKRKDIASEELLYPQFKGRVSSEEIDELFTHVRYTLLVPVIPGYATSKFVEMLQLGVLPFVHPSYDSQFNAIPADSPLRVKTPQELFTKIAWFDQNPASRIKLLDHLQRTVVAPCQDGSFVSDMINPYLEKHNLAVRI